MKWQQILSRVQWARVQHLLQVSVKTTRNRIVSLGLLFVCGFLAIRLSKLLLISVRGFSGGVLALGVMGVGLWLLWRDRQRLNTLQADTEDRLLGYLLIFGAIAVFPLVAATEWLWALLCLTVLAGIACSVWGTSFFRFYLLPTLLVFGALLPGKSPVTKVLWQTFTPPKMLEQLMAWAGSWGLRAIGQPAMLSQDQISLPGGAVQVDWGCNGFSMALDIAVMGLLIGLFFHLHWRRITLLILLGIALALTFNVPRIMVLAIAAADWGKPAFEFWHGFWGGQIFSACLFTVYYYIVMAILKRRPDKSSAPKTQM